MNVLCKFIKVFSLLMDFRLSLGETALELGFMKIDHSNATLQVKRI